VLLTLHRDMPTKSSYYSVFYGFMMMAPFSRFVLSDQRTRV
jgi:hypothetical protein